MKIKLIDRYNFTKFIDSQEVFGEGIEGIQSELLYSTPFGEVRFELTGETRKGVPYYRQARRQEEHQPAYNIPEPGQAMEVSSGRIQPFGIDPAIFNDINSNYFDTNGSIGGHSIGSYTASLQESLNQANVASGISLTGETLRAGLESLSNEVSRSLRLSNGVMTILRNDRRLSHIVDVYLADENVSMARRRDIANGNMSQAQFELTLTEYARDNRLI